MKSYIIVVSLVAIFVVGGVGMGVSFFDSESTDNASNVSHTVISKETACEISGGGVETYPIKCIGTPEQCEFSNIVVTTCNIPGGATSCEDVGGTYGIYKDACWSPVDYKIVWDEDSFQIKHIPEQSCGMEIKTRCILNNSIVESYRSQRSYQENLIFGQDKVEQDK